MQALHTSLVEPVFSNAVSSDLRRLVNRQIPDAVLERAMVRAVRDTCNHYRPGAWADACVFHALTSTDAAAAAAAAAVPTPTTLVVSDVEPSECATLHRLGFYIALCARNHGEAARLRHQMCIADDLVVCDSETAIDLVHRLRTLTPRAPVASTRGGGGGGLSF